MEGEGAYCTIKMIKCLFGGAIDQITVRASVKRICCSGSVAAPRRIKGGEGSSRGRQNVACMLAEGH